MLLLLYFAFLACSEIPEQFQDLVNRAIINSKTKIQRDKRADTAYPGDYSFPNVEFKLKRTLSSPITNDIKGYAIENMTVAIVKRKSFNLNESFIFVDPLEQKFYEMSLLVAQDDKVNIYQTKDMSIFDIMTNFNYHGKTDKALSPKINLNWDESRDGPELRGIPNIQGFEYGIGAIGIFTINVNFKFNSISDISLSASLRINIKSCAEIRFQDGESTDSEEFVLFTLAAIPIKNLGVSIKFVGINIVFMPYIKCDATMSDMHIKVPNKVNYLKGYEVVGTKRIEITPYSIVDSKWDIRLYNMPEGNSLEEVIDQLKEASFHLVPALRLYLSIEMQIGGIKSNFDIGLRVPFTFDFTFDKDKCLFPYLYGKINIALQSFYYFGGIEVTYKDATKAFKKKTRTLIKSSTNSITFFDFDTGMFCIGESNKVVEGSSSVRQQGDDRSYFVQNDVFNGINHEVQLVVEARDKMGNPITTRSSPFKKYMNSKAGSHMIVTTSEQPDIYWFFNGFVTEKVTKTKKILGFIPKKYTYYQTELKQSSEYKYEISENFDKTGVDVKPSMKLNDDYLSGNCKVWNLRNISINKVFQKEANSMFITQIPCSQEAKYALITLNKDGNTKIDKTASFYSDTMLSDSFSEKGAFLATLDHFEIRFAEFKIKSPMLLEINISIELTKNGKQETYDLGGISTEMIDLMTYKPEDAKIENQNFKFFVTKDNNPKMIMKCKTTIFKENGNADPTSTIYTFDYNDFQTYFYFITKDKSEVYFKFKKIEPLVSIKSEIVSNDEVIIAPVFVHNIENDFYFKDGQFEISTEKDQLYFILEFRNQYIQLSQNYIIIKCVGITPLIKDVIRLTNDVFCIPGDNDIMQIPFRRIDSSYGKLKIKYIVTQFNNISNINIDPNGEEVELTYLYQTKGFVVPTNFRYNLIGDIANLFFLKFPIDNETMFFSLGNNQRNSYKYTIIPANVNLEEDQYMVSYDCSNMKNLIKKANENSFGLYVTIDSTSVKAIRYNDIVSIISNNIAFFNFDLSVNDIIDFYAVCKDDTGKMCEITQTSESGEFQLLQFPNRDGINITGRGMMNAIIHAPENTNFSYYKTFEGKVDVFRSYPNDTEITVVVKDVNPKKNKKGQGKRISSEVSESSYREFCINDEDGNILPFSINYISENIDEFMKSIGAKSDFDITQYDYLENGCIIVDHDALKTNSMNELPSNIIDMTISNDRIIYNTRDMKYDPLSKKGKIAGIVVGSILGVVVIVIAVSIVISIKMKNKKDKSSDEQKNSQTTNIDEQHSNNDEQPATNNEDI